MNPKKAQYPFQLLAEFHIVSHSSRKTGLMTIEQIEQKNDSFNKWLLIPSLIHFLMSIKTITR